MFSAMVHDSLRSRSEASRHAAMSGATAAELNHTLVREREPGPDAIAPRLGASFLDSLRRPE